MGWERLKKKIQQFTGGKKLRKDQCLILVLIGMLLCVISLPTDKEKTKSNLWDISNGRIENKQTFDTEEVKRRKAVTRRGGKKSWKRVCAVWRGLVRCGC